MVIIAPTADDREQLMSRLAVRLGFAKVPSDGKKIIRKDIYSIDLSTAYFVLCSNYNFRGSIITTQRLYELAAKGICVVVGVKSLPREYERFLKCFILMTCVNISRDISVIYAIVLFPGALQRTRVFFFRSPRLPFILSKTFWTNVHGKARNVEKGIYILFLFFISFLKIPYLKIVENFVLRAMPCIFVIIT